MNHAGRNKDVQISVRVPVSVLLGPYLEVELLDHMVISYLNSSFTFLIGRYMLYNVVLASAVQQCESAVCIYAYSSLLSPPIPPP